MTQEQWGELKQNLLKTVGRNNYANWIEPLEFSEITEGVANLPRADDVSWQLCKQNFVI